MEVDDVASTGWELQPWPHNVLVTADEHSEHRRGALARPEGAQEGGGHGRSGQAGGRGRSGGAARRGAEVAPRLPEPEWHRGESGRGALLPGWDDRLSFTQTTQKHNPAAPGPKSHDSNDLEHDTSAQLLAHAKACPGTKITLTQKQPRARHRTHRGQSRAGKRARVRRARLLTSPAVYTREGKRRALREKSAYGSLTVTLLTRPPPAPIHLHARDFTVSLRARCFPGASNPLPRTRVRSSVAGEPP